MPMTVESYFDATASIVVAAMGTLKWWLMLLLGQQIVFGHIERSLSNASGIVGTDSVPKYGAVTIT